MIKSLFLKIKQNNFVAMVLCCAIPIIGIMALSVSGVLESWAYLLVFLLCPLGHIFMMRGCIHLTPSRPYSPKSTKLNPNRNKRFCINDIRLASEGSGWQQNAW
jgi:hypothetical protein